MNAYIQKHLKFNLFVNLSDGAFFGFAVGFASFVTIIPLFVRTMTSSALLIGLVPAIHNVGWMLPQLFTARWVARQRRYKPMALAFTVLERLPYLGLALVAWWMPGMSKELALGLTFAMLIWQGLGAGLTANPWQSMIAKIIPSKMRGTFLGVQNAAANMLASLGAVLAGLILQRLGSPQDFAWCFLSASFMMLISWVFLALAREPAAGIEAVQTVVAAVEGAAAAEAPAANEDASRLTLLDPPGAPEASKDLEQSEIELARSVDVSDAPRAIEIWGRDVDFRWFLLARIVSQIAFMGNAFYAVYAVDKLGMNVLQMGWLTGILMGTQVVANALMGWIGDRWSHRPVMIFGMLAAALSALLAWWAPTPGWFVLVYVLYAIGNVALWMIAMAMTMQFGSEAERPIYIGMSNTLIAPAAILAPFVGGWLAELSGYPATFLASALAGLAAAGLFYFRVRGKPASLPLSNNQAAG